MSNPSSVFRDLDGVDYRNPYGFEASNESKSKILTVIQVLDTFFKDVKIDKALGRRLYQFQIGYVNTSREYVEFFGSNLLGVHVIRFRETDVLRFFNEVLEIDKDNLEAMVRQCDTINHEFIVSSDIFNLALMYLLHRVLSEKSINDHDRTWMARNTALIFFYRAIAALLSAYFTYPADPKIAQAAYSNLSYKFLIKRLGSWHKVLAYRADELIAPSGTQFNKIKTLPMDSDLVELINSAANAMKDMVKNYYAEFAKVHAQGDRIGVTQTTGFDIEGEEVIRESVRGIDASIASIKKYMTDPAAFIRDDYIRVISDINKNTSQRLLKETLQWVCDNSSGKDFPLIDDAVSKIIIYSYYLIDTRIEPERRKDIAYVLIQLKNLYLSSRSTDEDLKHIRKQCDKILIKAHENLSVPLLLATRTALILYVTFRVMVGQRGG